MITQITNLVFLQFPSNEIVKKMNKKNQNSQNFHVTPNSYKCSITTDIAVFGYRDHNLKLLLTKREVGLFNDHWLLPGGVLEVNETLEECTNKILYAYTGLKNIHAEQVKVYADIARHPVDRVITISFFALVKPENHPLTIRDGIEQVNWFNIDEIPENLGFDHAQIIEDAHVFLKNNLNDSLIIKELLPQKFTLSELQKLYEDILGIKLDKRNFRKRILQAGVLKNTGMLKPGVKGGPVLYESLDKNE